MEDFGLDFNRLRELEEQMMTLGFYPVMILNKNDITEIEAEVKDNDDDYDIVQKYPDPVIESLTREEMEEIARQISYSLGERFWEELDYEVDRALSHRKEKV